MSFRSPPPSRVVRTRKFNNVIILTFCFDEKQRPLCFYCTAVSCALTGSKDDYRSGKRPLFLARSLLLLANTPRPDSLSSCLGHPFQFTREIHSWSTSRAKMYLDLNNRSSTLIQPSLNKGDVNFKRSMVKKKKKIESNNDVELFLFYFYSLPGNRTNKINVEKKKIPCTYIYI